MRLLDRYLLREVLVPFGYCLLAFFIFWVTFDLFANLSEFQKHQLQPVDVLEYFFFKTPELLGIILPITLLLALLYALTNHARHHELTAMRAAGLSLARLSWPYFGIAFALSLAVFALNEWWVPQSVERTEHVLNRYNTNRLQTLRQDWERNFGFTNTREKRTWIVHAFNRTTADLIRPHVEWLLPDGTRRVISAEGGFWKEGQWVFTNVQEYTYPPLRGAYPIQSNHDSQAMPEFTETPEEITIQIKLGKIQSFRQARKAQLSIREILIYKKLHPEDVEKNTMLHGRLSAPWTCLVVVLIALPFGANQTRRNVFVGVASSIMICFAYFVFQQLSLALGFSGRLPGWLAGWLPNLVFAITGLFLTLRIR